MAFTFTPQPRPKALDIMGTGGQGTRGLLTSTLREGQRRARLTGRNLSAAETEGITRGYFDQASARLGQRKVLALSKQGQDITMRGQDIHEMLAREKLSSQAALQQKQIAAKERMQGIGLGSQAALQQKQIAATERMQGIGLGSQAALQQKQIASTELMERERIDLGKMEVTAGILSSLLSGGDYVPDAPIDFDLWLKNSGQTPLG